MENLILAAHLLTALAIIGLILLQQGKGAEMGASFGAGASQTLFGSVGAGNFFSRLTAIFATIFFITSFVLAVMAKQKTDVGDVPLPALETIEVEEPVGDVPVLDEAKESAAEESEIPEVDAPTESTGSDEVSVDETVSDDSIPPAPVE